MGKFSNDDVSKVNLIEYSQFIRLLANYLPDYIAPYPGFKEYLLERADYLLEDYADTFVMTLPSPRTRYYEDVNYDVTQRKVTNYANEVTDALGYYPVLINLNIL